MTDRKIPAAYIYYAVKDEVEQCRRRKDLVVSVSRVLRGAGDGEGGGVGEGEGDRVRYRSVWKRVVVLATLIDVKTVSLFATASILAASPGCCGTNLIELHPVLVLEQVSAKHAAQQR